MTDEMKSSALGTVTPEMKKLRVLIYNFCKIEDGSLQKQIDLRKYAIASGQVVTNATVQELVIIHPKLLSLDMTSCNQVSDVGLWAIARYCTSIEKIILTGCNLITHVGLRSLSLTTSTLTELDLSNCTLIDDLSLTIIAGGNWKLRKVSLLNCSKITDNGVARLAQGCHSNLQILNLNGCPFIGEFGDRALKELGQHCKNLEELYVANAKRVEDPGFSAAVQGCPNLTKFHVNGCGNISKKSMKAMAQYCQKMTELRIIKNSRLQDFDYQLLQTSGPLMYTLTSLELYKFETLTDKAVAVICKLIGRNISNLVLSECPLLTDYACMIIGNFCPKLRCLDLTYCGQFTDEAIHALARKVSKLTQLKLDGNNRITPRALMKHIGREFDFVELANQWLGYQPKPQVEKLIMKKDEFLLHTMMSIKIQCLIRKKFARRVYYQKYQANLLKTVIPLFQSVVRGYLQRKRFRVIRHQLRRIRMATKIQTKFRAHFAYNERIRIIKHLKYLRYCTQMAIRIQSLYRGLKGRRKANAVRIEILNVTLAESRQQAIYETSATKIQRVFRGYVARNRIYQLYLQRQAEKRKKAYEELCIRFIQRIMRGKLGRMRAERRRQEIAWQKHCWYKAREIQRVFRGHLGRLRFKYFLELELIRRRNIAAVQIQRVYRGYRGKLLAAVARALRILRARQQFYALEIQRFVRGCMGRYIFNIQKEVVIRRRRMKAAAIIIQRVFRGHKAREARDVERELQSMEGKARPLFEHLQQMEEKANKLRVVISRLESMEQIVRKNVEDIEQELEHCLKTTNKFTDSARINQTPQRFLTKFLKVRLKDHLEHEEEVHKAKFKELQVRRGELRDLEREIMMAQRELIPLTTGLIVETKKNRSLKLRAMIWRRRHAALRIQALWRTALVRKTLFEENKSYWVIRYDQEQSDEPYYYNLISKEKIWKQPLAHRYFGELLPEQLQYLQLTPAQQTAVAMTTTTSRRGQSSRSLR